MRRSLITPSVLFSLLLNFSASLCKDAMNSLWVEKGAVDPSGSDVRVGFIEFSIDNPPLLRRVLVIYGRKFGKDGNHAAGRFELTSRPPGLKPAFRRMLFGT